MLLHTHLICRMAEIDNKSGLGMAYVHTDQNLQCRRLILFIRLLSVPQTTFNFLDWQVRRDGRVIGDNERQNFKKKSLSKFNSRIPYLSCEFWFHFFLFYWFSFTACLPLKKNWTWILRSMKFQDGNFPPPCLCQACLDKYNKPHPPVRIAICCELLM